jgi:hypothetical protein
MRDDFPVGVKDELAKRVGFVCSNPACRRPTSGPQIGASGTVNLGVAAHITAASPGGPRFDPDFSANQRASSANGIWLCQTCAKLVDNDDLRYPKPKLVEWKSDTETAAAQALEDRRSPPTQSQGVFLEAERLMPTLIADMRTDVRSDVTELIREFFLPSSKNVVLSSDRVRFYYARADYPGVLNQVDWLEDMGLVVDVTSGNIPKYRMTSEFVQWLRMS